VAVQQIRRFIRHNRAGRTDSPSCGLSRCIAAPNAVLKTVRASGPGARMRPRSRRTLGSRAGIVAARCDGTLRAQLHRLSIEVDNFQTLRVPRYRDASLTPSHPPSPPPSSLPRGSDRGEGSQRTRSFAKWTRDYREADLEALGNRLDARTLDGRVSFLRGITGRHDFDLVDLSNPALDSRKCDDIDRSEVKRRRSFAKSLEIVRRDPLRDPLLITPRPLRGSYRVRSFAIRSRNREPRSRRIYIRALPLQPRRGFIVYNRPVAAVP